MKKLYFFLFVIVLIFHFFFTTNYVSVHLYSSNIKLIEKTNLQQQPIYHSTIVSAFFDISRVGRPKEEYFEWIKDTQKLNAPFIFFVEKKYENIVSNIFKNRKKPFLIIAIELNELFLFKDIEKVNKIITSSDYKSRVSSNDRIECVNALYSIVIFSKFYLMKRATLMNPFESKKFIWMDAGISRFYAGFDLSLPINGMKIPDDKYLILFNKSLF